MFPSFRPIPKILAGSSIIVSSCRKSHGEKRRGNRDHRPIRPSPFYNLTQGGRNKRGQQGIFFHYDGKGMQLGKISPCPTRFSSRLFQVENPSMRQDDSLSRKNTFARKKSAGTKKKMKGLKTRRLDYSSMFSPPRSSSSFRKVAKNTAAVKRDVRRRRNAQPIPSPI